MAAPIALAHALGDALGVPVHSIPVTPDDVVRMLHARPEPATKGA